MSTSFTTKPVIDRKTSLKQVRPVVKKATTPSERAKKLYGGLSTVPAAGIRSEARGQHIKPKAK